MMVEMVVYDCVSLVALADESSKASNRKAFLSTLLVQFEYISKLSCRNDRHTEFVQGWHSFDKFRIQEATAGVLNGLNIIAGERPFCRLNWHGLIRHARAVEILTTTTSSLRIVPR